MPEHTTYVEFQPNNSEYAITATTPFMLTVIVGDYFMHNGETVGVVQGYVRKVTHTVDDEGNTSTFIDVDMED